MLKYLPLLFLTACATTVDNFGVQDRNNEPWPVVSVESGTLGWAQKKCGADGLPYRDRQSLVYAACTVPVDGRNPEKGVRVFWTWDCKFGRDHELQHAAEGFGLPHTIELEALLVQGRSMCLMRGSSNE